jgi:hypothetical protein
LEISVVRKQRFCIVVKEVRSNELIDQLLIVRHVDFLSQNGWEIFRGDKSDWTFLLQN